MSRKENNTLQRPAEILGTLTDDLKFAYKRLVERKRGNDCPFQEGNCNKQKHNVRTEEEERTQYFGVCSAYLGGTPYLICEARNEMRKILDKINSIVGFQNPYLISKKALESERTVLQEKVLNFKDSQTGKWTTVGRFDGILADYNEEEEDVIDFCGIETVSFDTTSTAKLNAAVKDFVNKGSMDEKYNYGINFAHTYKLMIPQIILKGRNLERWGKKYFWVIQKTLYEHMTKSLNFRAKDEIDDDDSLYFLLFSLNPDRQSNKIEYEINDIKSLKNVTSFKKQIEAVKCSKESLTRRIRKAVRDKIEERHEKS